MVEKSLRYLRSENHPKHDYLLLVNWKFELFSCDRGQRLADEDEKRYHGVNNRSLAVSGTIVLSKEVITYQKDAFVADHVNNSIVPLRCNKKCIQDWSTCSAYLPHCCYVESSAAQVQPNWRFSIRRFRLTNNVDTLNSEVNGLEWLQSVYVTFKYTKGLRGRRQTDK